MRRFSSRSQGIQRFSHNFEAGEQLEIFFVSAITAILLIRLYLEVTGYPQLGHGGLHIAHVLWGGLLMLLAMLARIIFIGHTAETLAALVGGVGFGTFIDEIGKFITKDNDYFYQPSVALIYITFIFIIVLVRLIRLRRRYTRSEYLVNALKTVEYFAMHRGGPDEQALAIEYLDHADGSDPFVRALRSAFAELATHKNPASGSYNRIKTVLRNVYVRIVRLPGFNLVVTLTFTVQLVGMAMHLFVLVFLKGLKFEQLLRIHGIALMIDNINSFGFIEWAELGVTFYATVFILAGMIEIRWSRLRAYVLFERSVLINIFVTQVLLFYQDRFGALVGLFVNLFLLLALRYMIRHEQEDLFTNNNQVVKTFC